MIGFLVISGAPANNNYNEPFYKKLNSKLSNSKHLDYININDSDSENNNVQSINVLLTGPVYGMIKEELFVRSSVFINPSSFENYGQSIVEALSYNLPVIISENTPWNSIE